MVEKFQNIEIKSTEVADKQKEEKQKRKVIPKEKYIRNYTAEGKVLSMLEKDPEIIPIVKKFKGNYANAIKNLENNFIIKINRGKVVNIDYEKFQKVWENTQGYQISNLLEKKDGLTVAEIAAALEKTKSWANEHTSNMLNSGLLEAKRIGLARVFSLPKDLIDCKENENKPKKTVRLSEINRKDIAQPA